MTSTGQASPPEPWLRGPVPGVPRELMPAAHALLQVAEDVARVVPPLPPEALWMRPGGAASVAYHVRHLAGSLDRLLTYARGEQLSGAQRAALRAEGETGDPAPSGEALARHALSTIERAIETYRATDPATLWDGREVGRARLPSNVLGLLVHAAEHSQRHAGQIVTTAKIVTGLAAERGDGEPR